ncbi:MAG: hypothetical protein PHW10_05320 [Candidatus Peribacteraceae bacterium]|nr:hypothetical protein [Candidatus Peribacteraceae bacterium]
MNLLRLSGLLLLALPQAALALTIAPPAGGGGNLEVYLVRAAGVLQDMLIGVLTLALVLNGARMIIKSGSDAGMTEGKQGMMYAVAAVVVASVAGLISATVTSGPLFTAAPVLTPLNNVYKFFVALLYAALTANIVIQGFRMIASHGSQEMMERARKRLIQGFIGAVVVLLADFIVKVFIYGNIAPVKAEIVGLANFLLAFVAIGILIVIILGGLILVVSVDESLKSKAQQAIKTGIIVLLVVGLSAAVINAVLDAVS